MIKPSLTLVRRMKAPPERVFAALTRPEMLVQWWGPDPTPPTFVDPDNPQERLVNSAALDAIRALLLENARLRRAEEHLRGEVEVLHETHLGLWFRLRRKVVRRLEGGRLLPRERQALAHRRRADHRHAETELPTHAVDPPLDLGHHATELACVDSTHFAK